MVKITYLPLDRLDPMFAETPTRQTKRNIRRRDLRPARVGGPGKHLFFRIVTNRTGAGAVHWRARAERSLFDVSNKNCVVSKHN
jgi:hypothetical protein